jgi:hypothetical protein
LGEPTVGEVADAYDPNGCEVARPAFGAEDRGERIDEPLWNCVACS